MPSARSNETLGFLIATFVCAPLLFFGWWAVCFVDVPVALILFYVPRYFGASARRTLFFGTFLLLAIGACTGFYERGGLVEPGPTGVEEAVLGIMTGVALISLPAMIAFGILYAIRMLPSTDSENPDETMEEEKLTETDEASPPEEAMEVAGSRKCPACGTLVMGSEERCWRCGKRV